MDCWYPINVRRRLVGNIRYKNSKTGKTSVRLGEYENGSYITVPCGRCPACRRRKQNEWAYRILEEAKSSRLTAFVTLTYDDHNLKFSESGVPTLDPERLHKFFKDLRYNFSFRYFACGEYGDKFERPHYHFILFYNGMMSHEQLSSFIASRWTEGFIKYEPTVTAGRAKYCAKYSMKQIGFDYGDVVPPFARMSRRPGIGKGFLENISIDNFRKLNIWHLHDYQGTPYTLPRYYKERIYSREECDTHSLLLEKLKNSQLDCNIRESDHYFKFYADTILNRERLFIKHLKQENYGFRYKPKERQSFIKLRPDDFQTDEF